MNIRISKKHAWRKPLFADPMQSFGKNNQERLRSTLAKIPETNITHVIEPLNERHLEWYTLLYNETISQKENPKHHDLLETTIEKDSPYPYYMLILSEGERPIGGTIFTEREDFAAVAYRIYPNTWDTNKLRANPSLYSEYVLNKYANARGYTELSHGRDRNPYGVNASIGLAIFKLSVGCSPYLPNEPELETIDTDSLATDALILEAPSEGNKIMKAYLYADDEACEKFNMVTKFPERLTVEVIPRT